MVPTFLLPQINMEAHQGPYIKDSTWGPSPLPCCFGGVYVGGSRNDDPVLGPLNSRCRIVSRTQKGTMILTTTHIMNL